MITKKILILVSLIGSIIGCLIIYPDKFGICSLIGNVNCYYNFPVFSIGEPLLNFSVCIFVVAIIINFFPENIFHFWTRFAYWWILLSALIIFLSPITNHDWGIVNPTREIMSWVMGGLLIIISLLLIAFKSYKLREK